MLMYQQNQHKNEFIVLRNLMRRLHNTCTINTHHFRNSTYQYYSAELFCNLLELPLNRNQGKSWTRHLEIKKHITGPSHNTVISIFCHTDQLGRLRHCQQNRLVCANWAHAQMCDHNPEIACKHGLNSNLEDHTKYNYVLVEWPILRGEPAGDRN